MNRLNKTESTVFSLFLKDPFIPDYFEVPCYTKHYLIVKATATFASILVYMALSMDDHVVVPCTT